MSSTLAQLERVRDRLVRREPIRILIGHSYHDASAIEPAPVFAGRIRSAVLADILSQIDGLTEPSKPEGKS